jgi:hypothetical protein
MVDAVTKNCINGIPTNTESESEILQLPVIQDGGNNHEILDTRDLSQVNFLYNDIIFEIYPGLEISND